MAGDVKEYLVNYIVNSTGNAPDLFERLAKQASAAQASISESVKNIQTITGQLTKAFLGTKDAWNIEPTVDNTKALEALKDLEKKVKEASARMRKDIASALNGAMPGLTKDKKAAGGTIDELQNQLDNYKRQLADLNSNQVKAQKEFLKKSGSQGQRIKKDVEQLWGKDDINSKVLPKISKFPEAQNILKDIKAQIDTRAEFSKQITELEKQLQSAPKPATTPVSAARQGYAATNMVAKNDLTKKLENQIKIQERAQARYNELLAARKRAMYDYGSQNISGLYPNWQTVFGSAEETAKLPKFLQNIVAGEQNGALERSKKDVDKSNSIVSTLKKQLEDVSKIAGEKPVTIVATLNTTPAIEKANELIKTIGMRSVTIPITFGRLGEKPSPLAGEDSISKETGRLTEAGRKLTEQTNKLMEKQKSQTAKNAKVELPGIVKQMTDSVKSLNSILEKQPVNVIGKFDGGMLLGQLQEVMSSLKAYAKANPIPVLAEMSKATASTKGEKVVDQGTKGTKGAKVNPIADSVIENSRTKIQTKAYEKPITFRSAFNGGDAAFQANMARQRIQQLVGEKPITFRSAFNGGDAAFQAQQSLVRLQKLVSEKPVNVIGKFSGVNGLNNANGGKKPEIEVMAKVVTTATQLRNQVNALTVKIKPKEIGVGLALKKDAINQQLKTLLGKLRQSGKSKAIEIPVKIKGEKVSSKVNSIISQAKKASNVGKGISVPVKFVTKDVSSKFNTLIKDLQTKANKNPIRIKAQFENGNILTQFNQSIANLQKNVERLAKMKIGNNAIGGVAERGTTTRGRASNAAASTASAARANRDSYARSMGLMPTANERVYARQQPDRYTRMRSFLYPLTGNTSFGARTPAMVDMANGMGTMFAVGGAMSAVGSSLSQAVEYQNTMKTAQAILQNGTTDYNKRDFDNMTKTVRNVGKDTKFTAPDVANAARFMAMAGLHTNDITKAIRPVADVALIGDTDLGATADKLTNVMTTFDLKPEQMRDIADIMTSTFTRSNTDMMMLAESAKYAGGIAHLYGSNFKDTFADTMALFGVLGNAGIQASSAGTTIRMMYQNLMQPNKKQLEALKKYNIYTRDTKGQPLQMGDILVQMSQKIPKSQMADAIGQMFRITAQPGAAALASNMDNVRQLIAANRNAPGSGISERIAGEKQNTLSGLWAQVTSTFTEAVVQAMENRQDKWGEMLKRVRNYLGDPKTVEMISNIIDLVEMLARTMAEFAKIWAGAYHMFPNLINGWLKVQMLLTQVGYLFTPIVQITGAITMFKNALLGLGTALGGASVATRSAAIANRTMGVGSAVSGIAAGAGSGKYAATRFASNTMGVDGAAMATYQAAKYKKWQYEVARNRLRNSVVYNGQRTAVSPLWYGTMAQFGVDAAASNQWLKERSQFAATNIEARQAAAQRADAAVKRQQSIMNEQLRAMRRPEQLANNALMMRYATMYGGQKGANPNWIARGNQIREANAAALVARRPAQLANKELLRRFYMSGGKGALGLGMKGAFQRGLSIGTIGLSFTSLFGGIKSSFYSLMSGMAKAVGLLVSPVGLATAGIAALTVGVIAMYKHFKKQQDQRKNFVKINKQTTELYNQQRQKVIDNADENINKIKRVNVNLSSGIKPITNYPQQKNYFAGNKVVSSLTNEEKSNAVTPFDLSASIDNNHILAPEVTRAFKEAKDSYFSASGASYFWGQQKKASEKAKELGVISQWANIATKQPEIIAAVKEMRAAVAKNDTSRQEEILSQFAPDNLNAVHMTGSGMSAWQLSKIQDPSKYYEWQYAQYKYLQEAQMQASQASHYNQAVNMINGYDKMSAKQQSGYDATALVQQLVQSVPLMINNTPAAISLTKMGGIDWTALANTVNNGVPFTLQQQQEILSNTYSAILDDPNIKNVAGIGDLLKIYLPKIAKARSPYDDFDFGYIETGTYASRQGHFDKPKVSEKQAPKVPIKPGSYIPQFKFNLGGVSWTGGSQFDKDVKSKGVVGATIAHAKRQGVGSNTPTVPNGKNGSRGNKSGNSAINFTTRGTTANPATSSGKKSTPSNQKDYASSYGRNAARPTQVNITIENLCRFDRTSISKNADDRAMVEAIENKISEAVAMLSASALNTAGQTISQGLA